MPERHRAILERRIAGQTLQEIGEAFGITRERVRQIEVKWRTQGLIVPGARPLSDVSAARLGWHEPKRRGPKPKTPTDFWAVAMAAAPGAPKNPYRISETERERRRQWGRGLAAIRGGAPA
jgi:hypothetical protein